MDDRSAEVGQEVEFDREQTLESDKSRRAAVHAAMIAIGLPAGLAFLCYWFLCLTLSWNERHSKEDFVSFLVFGGFAVAVMTQLGGIFCGYLAHRFFSRSAYSVVTMSVAMAITIDAALFGWIIVVNWLAPTL